MATCPTCGQKIPDVVVPSTGLKPYPLKVVFDKTSDQGSGEYFGTACVLLDPGMSKVTLNGEVAFKGNQYKGKDVWRFKKVGNAYTKPWTFVFTHSTGPQYSYVINESGSTPATPDAPAGGHTETVKPTSYGNPDSKGRKRGNARFSHPGSWYGRNIQILIDGKLMMTVPDGSKRDEGNNGLLWKPVSDSNGRLVVVGPYGLTFKECTIKW